MIRRDSTSRSKTATDGASACGHSGNARRVLDSMRALYERAKQVAGSTSGQTLVEFALILVFATIVVVFALSSIGPDVAEPLNAMANNL